jgi:molybdopterin synthase catalytic subunit
VGESVGFDLSETPLEVLPPLEVPRVSGAVTAFWGRVRDHNEGRSVTGLEYSAYPELAVKEGRRIVAEAAVRFGLDAVRAVHRVGVLTIGEAALVVEVTSGHRGEAFEGCRWIVDEIKHRVPIWKLEHYAEGDREWVMCHHGTTTDAS